MSARRGRPTDGYVLVEALATLTLSALLIAGLAALVALVLGAADRSALAVQALETTDRAMAAVARDVAAAVRARTPKNVDGRPPRFLFEGASDRLTLVVDRVDDTGLARPVAVRWQSRLSASGRGVLERAEALLPPVSAGLEEVAFGPPHAVDTGPVLVTFAYYGPQPDGSGDILTDQWLQPGGLPTGIRLGRTDPADGSLAGSVRIAFPIGGEPGCALPDKGYCSLSRRDGTGDAAGSPTGEGSPGGDESGGER